MGEGYLSVVGRDLRRLARGGGRLEDWGPTAPGTRLIAGVGRGLAFIRVPPRFPPAFARRRVPRPWIDCETVVVAADLNGTCIEVQDWLVGSSVPELQLVRGSTEGEPEQLAAETDTEDRLATQ